MATEIGNVYSEADVELVESSGGVFEVTVDGELVFSKQQLGRHAEPGEVVRLIQERTPS
ncbi:MAG: SelT/SelW/SelH family protein [Gemmatimonadales bacterium]|nr:SelT/SelW/SelH family protein [Gemmatimonadales bacterium]NIN10373.1 SelT/SelW/SelH family protein [Gemmatimonadales bacterium]NIN49165.1 SelT/SelW/SelH family protein [Gemmatimonadales bacterium]NIP06629.1 SelT/SelW/SelH family protein [Gemmatimonadales bacterium]NIQ99959.1 SelT/SelW/SelH family protein [Gemmatimonadales bacterium]